jgi:ElaB/YqjD/DUF883 family membrane-anchored ribosome-binding protein
MENEPEVIRQQMEDTRTALTEKLENLEEQVVARVRNTTDSVNETVENVKEAVENTVQTVSNTVDRTVESVKETFDVRRQFEQRPWLMLGGAVLVGYIGGRLLDRMVSPVPTTNGYYPELSPEPAASHYQAQPAPAKPSWGEEVVEHMKPALSKLGQLAIGVTTGIIGEMVREQIPEALQKDVGEIIDEVTRSLGGKPLHGFLSHESGNLASDSSRSATSQVP